MGFYGVFKGSKVLTFSGIHCICKLWVTATRSYGLLRFTGVKCLRNNVYTENNFKPLTNGINSKLHTFRFEFTLKSNCRIRAPL